MNGWPKLPDHSEQSLQKMFPLLLFKCFPPVPIVLPHLFEIQFKVWIKDWMILWITLFDFNKIQFCWLFMQFFLALSTTPLQKGQIKINFFFYWSFFPASKDAPEVMYISEWVSEGTTRDFTDVTLVSVCDDTQNLNETKSETLFQYQIFPTPNPILFSIPNFFDTNTKSMLNPKPSKKWEGFEIEKFRNRNVTQNIQNLN